MLRKVDAGNGRLYGQIQKRKIDAENEKRIGNH